jgi:Skp family chaperone for outer membrane proteins
MKKSITLIIFLLAAAIITEIQAQQVIAYADMQYIVDNSSEGKRMKEIMDREFKKKQEETYRRETELQQRQEQLRALGDRASDSDREKLERDIMRHQQIMLNDQQELRGKRENMMNSLRTKIERAAVEVAQQYGITYVLYKEQLIGSNGGIDITEQIIAQLNK